MSVAGLSASAASSSASRSPEITRILMPRVGRAIGEEEQGIARGQLKLLH